MTAPADRRDVYARVLKALPLAHLLIARAGIDPEANDADGYGPDITILDLAKLPAALPDLFTDEQTAHVEHYGHAAYILGIAVGLLLNPTTIFTRGGAR